MSKGIRALQIRNDFDFFKYNEMKRFFIPERIDSRNGLNPVYTGIEGIVTEAKHRLGGTADQRASKNLFVRKNGLRLQNAEELAYSVANPDSGWRAYVLGSKKTLSDGEKLYDVLFVKKAFPKCATRENRNDIILVSKEYNKILQSYELGDKGPDFESILKKIFFCIGKIQDTIEYSEELSPELFAWIGLLYTHFSAKGSKKKREDRQAKALKYFDLYNLLSGKDEYGYDLDEYRQSVDAYLKAKVPMV